MDDNGKEYSNVRVLLSKLKKTKEQEKPLDKRETSKETER